MNLPGQKIYASCSTELVATYGVNEKVVKGINAEQGKACEKCVVTYIEYSIFG